MRKAIEFDATGYLLDQYNDNKYVSAVVDTMTNPFSTLPNAIKLIKGDDGEGRLEEIERKSYLTGNKAGEFVKEATTSIGQMAPGLALSFVPGVGPALSMAYTGVSAGGNSMEGALQQGAGYNNAFTYGILSGATEAAMEKLGGWDFGNPTTFMGKLLAGTKLGAWASKGLGKAITGAVSEGVEELGSDFADPVNKWVTGVDTDIGANFRKAYEESGKTFLMGATVGSIMQGGQVLGQNISNKEAGRGGAKATRADSSLAYVSESAQNYGKNEALNKKTDKAVLQGLTDIGVQMTQMSKSERDIYLESLGEYKNAFNEDGSIKQDLENPDINTEAVSRKLKPISATLKHAPISSSEQISEGASQAKSHIEKVLGSKANVVITSDSKETNAFFSPDENVFYINNNSATLNDADGAIKKASLQVSFHEMTHSAEGTKQYNEFVNELANIITDKNAPVEVKKKLGNFNKRKIAAIIDYAEQTKGMSKAQARYTVDTEVIADLSGDLMADDYIVNKLAERNAPLLKKLISRFKGTIKKSTTVDGESIKYLKKLVSRFEKALDNAQGGVKISQIGNADEEREEKADSSQQTADSKVDDERKSYAGIKARTANGMNLKNAKKMLEQGIDAETIRKETGWFKGYDGKWRFEIDDSKMDISTSGLYSRNIKVRRYAELVEKVYFEMAGTEAEEQELGKLMNEVEEITPKKIGDMVYHPELFKAYPELQNIDVIFLDNITGAAYNPGLNEIVISQQYKLNKIQLKETVIHELQHAVQTIEGFASGSSPEYWDEAKTKPTSEETNKIKSVENEFNQVRRKIIEQYGFEACGEFEKYFDYDRLYIEGDEADAEFAQSRMEELEERFKEKHLEDAFKDFSNAYMKLESTKQEIKFQKRKQSSYSLYMNTAGEIEARDSAKRKDLDAEQRKNTRPDIDRTDVVFAEDSTRSYEIKHPVFTEQDIKSNKEVLAEMEPVVIVDAKKLEKTGKSPKEIFAEFFDNLGNNIKTEMFGDVALTNSSVKSEIRHGITAEKIASIEAIPTVLEQGKVIFSKTKPKSDIERIVVAAPIKIGQDDYYMGVMLQRDTQNQRLYLHNVVAIKAEEATYTSQDDSLTNWSDEDNSRLFITSILQNAIKVKLNSKKDSDERKSVKRSYEPSSEVDSKGSELSLEQADYFKDSKVRDKDGNLLVVYHGTEATFNIYKSNSGYEEYFFTDNYDAAVDYGSKVKKQYLNITNPYIVDFKGRYDKEIFDAIDYAKENGFDGVIALNTFDGANTHNQYVAFSKNQIKNTDNKSPTKNPDIRYSKQRSYEPGKESEFEEALKSKYGSTSTDLSKYKKAKSSKASEKTFSQDEMLALSMKLLKVTSDRDKSNKKIVELTKALNQAKGDLKRYEKTITSLADELNSKKYSSNDVAMAMEALLSVDSPLGRSIELKDADYDAAVRKLKNDLNSKTDFNSKANAALELAKFIVKKGMVTEYTVDSNMQEAIEFLDDLKPLLDNESISTDDAIAKLNELGFDTSDFTSDNVFDAIKTIYDDAYAIVADNIINYRVSIYNTLNAKQAHELTQKIAKEILASYEKIGEKTKLSDIVKKNTDKINGLKEDLKTAYERNKFENRILREISKMAEIQSGKYVNSTQAKPEVFSALQSLLKKLDSRGQLNRTSTRKILAKLAEWYIPENPMLKSFGAEGSENKNTGFFSQEMYEKIQYFVEDKGKERLSITELKEVNEILHHINYIFENYGKIWRGNRYVEALDVAKEYAQKLNIAEKDVPAFARLLFKNAITKNLNDPMSVCASWDGHDENGFFTQTYREFTEALIKQKHDEMTALAELVEFEKKNKKYFKALINGKSKVKVTGRINVREGKIDTVEMPKYAAIDIYMTSRTGNAIDTFEQTGYTLKLDGQHIEDDFQTISREQIEAMYNDFTEQDKELIKILDKAYNGICRDLKYDCDMRRLGWSNVFEGIYCPLYRAHSVDFDKDDFKSVMSRVSNVSSNHTRVYSKNAIVVSNAITKFMRHVNDVTRYANLAIPVENLNILYNLDTGDNARMPTSIKTRLTKSNFWKGADEYLFDLTNDVQGVGKELSSGNKAIAWLRGSYAKYQLGANPKVWFSQLSSYFASFGELRIGSLLKAFSLKDTYTNSDVDEYCKLAAVRSYERGASSAMAVSEKIGQAGSLLTKPIEFVDRRVVCALFSACQFEAQARYKLEVGTKANKVKAGEILTDVILKTQQNQLVTEQSKVMREKSEIIKSFTMFSADQMKLNSRFCQTLSELATINKKLKDAKKANNQKLVEELTEKRNGAIKKLAKYSSSIVTIAFYMAALAKAVQAFRRKDEDEPIGEWLFKEAGLNLLTTVPFFRDVVSFFTDGFEADIFAISMVNDVLNATDEMKNNFADMANGKEVTSQQWLSSGRKAVYAIGQLAGFPIRNIYNVITGWTRRIDQSAGATVDSWFKAPSDTDLKESYKEAKAKGNVSLAGKSLDLIYKNHDMELTDAVLKKELDRLNGLDITKKDDDKSNYSVIAKRAPETVTIDGEEVELTAKQKNAFKTAYKTAEKEAGKMVRVYRYKKLDSASQSYAIRKIYEYQYSKAEESLTGERARLVYFGDIIGMDKLALILGYANSLKGDKDRKEKIAAYIKSMGLISQHASLALRFLGYSDKDNDSKVKNFINARSSLTREQKAELLEMLKLD